MLADPISVLFVAFPGADLLDIAGPIDVLRTASRVVELEQNGEARRRRLYEIRVCAPRGGVVHTGCGLEIAASLDFSQCQDLQVDTVVVPGGDLDFMLQDAAVTDFISALAPRCRRVVSMGTGAFVLAKAGLLNSRSATTHWDTARELAARFPEVRLQPERVFVEDDGIYTSAGAASSLDVTLALVQEDMGPRVAAAIARSKVMFVKRRGDDAQVGVHLRAEGTGSSRLSALAEWILQDPSRAIGVGLMADKAAVSTRTLARLFKREFNTTPTSFVEAARLQLARRYLESSDAPVSLVARKAGFGSYHAMRRAFQNSLACSPREYRRNTKRAPIAANGASSLAA